MIQLGDDSRFFVRMMLAIIANDFMQLSTSHSR